MTHENGKPRTTVVTGARSGIGKATAELLQSRDERVIGIDLADCAVVADLAHAAGRTSAVAAVHELCPDGIDALIACAGVVSTDGPAMVSVNFFGAVELAEGLRPLLARGDAPRAVIISSSATLLPFDEAIAGFCLAGYEDRARLTAHSASEAEAITRVGPIYAATKRALTRWIRRAAPRPEWAGAGILLNGVAPGLVRTPMTAPMFATEAGRAILDKSTPRATAHPAEAEDIAMLLAFLASPDNRYMVGQVPFCDGGTEVMMRGEGVF